MQRYLFRSLCAAGTLAALFCLHACQKEAEPTTPATANGTATPRYAVFYGVTVATATQPSVLNEIDQNTGLVTNSLPIALDQGGGSTLPIDDVRGICYLGQGKYAITTAPNPIDVLTEALMFIDVTTGLTTYVSTSTVGTVSDIDYDPVADVIYGLQGNNLVIIAGPNYDTYTSTPLTGFNAGYTARGLTMVGDVTAQDIHLEVAATQNGPNGTAEVYKVDVPFFVVDWFATLDPANDFWGGNCGLSYQLTPASELYVNRSALPTVTTVPGLNRCGGWPQNGTVNTGAYDTNGFDYEDLTSDIGL